MKTKQLMKGLRAAAAAPSRTDDKTPLCYVVAKKRVVCAFCGSEMFVKRQLRLVVGDLSPHALVCSQCSQLTLFASEPDEVKA